MRPAPNWQKLIIPVLLIMPRGRRIEEGAGDDHDPSDDGIPIGHAVRRDRFRKAVVDDAGHYLLGLPRCNAPFT
jgi:hypothetical protein